MSSQSDLVGVMKKLIIHYDSQQTQGGVKLDKLSPILDNLKQVCITGPPISEQLNQSALNTCKQLFGKFKDSLSDLSLREAIFVLFVRILAAISFSFEQTPLVFKQNFIEYFIDLQLQNINDIFISTLSEFPNVCAQFWWPLLCLRDNADDIYIEFLKKFLDNFLKKPVKMVSTSNTVIYVIRVVKLNANLTKKKEIIRKSLLQIFEINHEYSDESHTLSSIKFVPSNRETAIKILKLIKEQGDDILREILRSFAKLADDFDVPKKEAPSPDDSVEINYDDDDGSWVLETLRLRYIMTLVDEISQDSFKSIFEDLIPEMNQPLQRSLFLFASQFDSHRNDIILKYFKNPEYIATTHRFIGHLAIIFAPIFLKIQKADIIALSDSAKNRNKRMNNNTIESRFIEEASKICTDPLRFEKFLCDPSNSLCKYPNNSLFLYLSLQSNHEWQYDEALNYVTSLIDGYGHESEFLYTFISRISLIQSHLINRNLGIDHHFLAKNFFDRIIAEMSDDRLKSAIYLVKSSSINEDFTDTQREKWIEYILQGLNSPNYNTASTIVLYNLTHLAPQSFCLCEPFLKVNPDPPIEYLPTLLTIYVICFNSSSLNGKEDMMRQVISIITGFIQNLPRDDRLLGCIITLFFEDLLSDKQKMSPDLISLVETFMKKDDDCRPALSLRMLNIFPSYHHLIFQKYPTFFDTFIPCLMNILSKPSTDLTLYQLTIDTLVDTMIRLPKSGQVFLEIHSKLVELTKVYDDDKIDITNTAIDQFLSRNNHQLIEMIPKDKVSDGEEGSAYIINPGSFYKLQFESERITLTSKTRSGSSMYTIKSDFSNSQNEAPSKSDVDYFDPIPHKSNSYNKSFSNFVDEYSILDRDTIKTFENEYIPNQLNQLKLTSSEEPPRPFNRPINVLPKLPKAKNEKDDGPEILYQSRHAVAFFESLTLGPNSSNSLIKRPFPLLDITAMNIFNNTVREMLKIGFLYVRKDQNDQNSILKNSWDKVSPQFQDFCRSIGAIIDLSTHTGFTGKLDNIGYSNGRYQLYFATDRFEVMYHVVPLLPTDPNDAQQIYKKRHIGNDNVHIVWSEHTFDYEPATITSQFNDAHIVVYPIHGTDLFYRVVVYKKIDEYHFGPLQEESIVSVKALPTLVKWTSIFSDRVSREKTTNNYKLPNQIFKDSINEITKIKKGGEE